ncbi:MAG: PAS domain S-box protein, partial [Thermodesulfobacteriota bacterium]
ISQINNITERRKAEEELRTFSLVVEQSPASTMILDREQNIEYVNPACVENTGYSVSELVGEHVDILRSGEHPPEFYEGMLATVESGDIWRGDVCSRRKDGVKVWEHINISPVKGLDGEITRFLSVKVEDVERRRAEEALKESEEKFRSLAENIQDYIMRYDEQCRHMYVNPACIKVSGLKEEDFIGKTHRDAGFDEELCVLWESQITKVFKTGQISQSVFNWEGAEGKVFLDLRLYPEFDDNGKVRSVLGISRDITESKNAEEALQAKTREVQALAQMMDKSSQPFAIGTPDGRLMKVNAAYCDMTGYSEEELLDNISWNETLTPPEWREYEGDMLKALLATGEPQHFEKEYIRKDGKRISVELIMHRSVDADNNLEYVYGNITDITDRKRAEEKIKASLSEKEVLLKEIHHRVKNNLQIVSSILNLQSGYIDDKELQRIFKESQDRIRSMALVHEQLYQSKDISHISFPGYIKALIANIFKSYAHSPSMIELKMEVEEIELDIDTSIILGLILNELCTNALKYAFGEGKKREISVEFKRVDSDNYLLSLSDNGVGLPGEFDILKAESMGFLLVKSLIKQLDGNLEIDQSAGTSFKMVFPG